MSLETGCKPPLSNGNTYLHIQSKNSHKNISTANRQKNKTAATRFWKTLLLFKQKREYRPLWLVCFVFPFQTIWCPHGNLPFVSFISYAYISRLCSKGLAKLGNIVAETMFLVMFPGVAKLGNICFGHKNVFDSVAKTFLVSKQQNLFPQHMFPARLNWETFASATMFPQPCFLV